MKSRQITPLIFEQKKIRGEFFKGQPKCHQVFHKGRQEVHVHINVSVTHPYLKVKGCICVYLTVCSLRS